MKAVCFICAFLFLSVGLITAQTDSAKAPSKEIFTIVEVQPEFVGGVDSLMSFLKSNIEYPAPALKSNIQGTVYISFVVEPDGSISTVKCLRGIGGGCDEEAMRVVKMMPKWKPGLQRGEPVRVYFNLPVRFIIQTTPKETTP